MHLNDLNREVKTIFPLTDFLTYTEIDENVTRIAQGFKYSLGISRRMAVILQRREGYIFLISHVGSTANVADHILGRFRKNWH